MQPKLYDVHKSKRNQKLVFIYAANKQQHQDQLLNLVDRDQWQICLQMSRALRTDGECSPRLLLLSLLSAEWQFVISKILYMFGSQRTSIQ